MTLSVLWFDGQRCPTEKPNPDYPEGIVVDLSNGDPSCETAVPYPAKRCGFYAISCDICGTKIAVTTAGRPDDPRIVKVRCKLGAKQ